MIATARPKQLPRVVAPSSNTLIPGEWIAVTIPIQPPQEVNPNAHGKRRDWMRAKKDSREAARLATVSVVNRVILHSWDSPFPEGARLVLTVTIGWGKGRREIDYTNAVGSLKAIEDGFAAALGMDDRQFRLASVRQVRDHDGLGWVRIEAALARVESGASV